MLVERQITLRLPARRFAPLAEELEEETHLANPSVRVRFRLLLRGLGGEHRFDHVETLARHRDRPELTPDRAPHRIRQEVIFVPGEVDDAGVHQDTDPPLELGRCHVGPRARGFRGPALVRWNPRRRLERLLDLRVRREIRLRKLEQNLEASRSFVCALADALHDIVREELLEALDWGLDVLEVDPPRSV